MKFQPLVALLSQLIPEATHLLEYHHPEKCRRVQAALFQSQCPIFCQKKSSVSCLLRTYSLIPILPSHRSKRYILNPNPRYVSICRRKRMQNQLIWYRYTVPNKEFPHKTPNLPFFSFLNFFCWYTWQWAVSVNLNGTWNSPMQILA